ncbi:E3 ubiquitin-protein ligase TRIM71-like [Oopsacas minuta]|uniref:E3 ubiquitin-protein ligase TRIM71-like n=1 Tax=Oopsacas minuta TaxID=111878 RepID=A0AAV7KDQ8_9METZ|nr:E3 ubiquitin-protein ligase TRIM71-like [Oopsacas minuta]
MASLSSLGSKDIDIDPFISRVQEVRVEIRDKFTRARHHLEARETELLAKLKQVEDDYTGEGVCDKVNQLKISKDNLISTFKDNENKEMLDQSLSPIESRIKELETKLQTAKDTYKSIAFDWEDELELKLKDVGKILLNTKGRGIPDYGSITSPVKVFGKHSKSIPDPAVFVYPEGLAVDPVTKYLYVCDMGFNRVQVFNSSFEFLFLFNEKMKGPAGICIKQDKVYVTQVIGNHLNVYSTIGKFLQNNVATEFGSPRGLDVSVERKRIYVSDGENNRVQCLNLDLSFHSFIDELYRPVCVKLMSEEIAVLCRQSPCLILYNYSHQPVREMIACGEDNTVKLPMYIYIDGASNILLSDIESHCVFVFSYKGELIHKIGEEGEKRGEFIHPTGFTIDPDNRIIVASRNPTNCIQLF